MKKEELEIYEKAVFDYAFKNKIDSDNAEKEFLGSVGKDRPKNSEEFKALFDELSIKKHINMAVGESLTKTKFSLSFNFLSQIFTVMFYVLFIINKFKYFEKVYIVFLPMIGSLIFSVLSIVFTNKPSNDKLNSVSNDVFKNFKNSYSIVNKVNFVTFVKNSYSKNPAFYGIIIKNTIKEQTQSNKFINFINTLKDYTRYAVYIIACIPFIYNLPIFTHIFSILIYTSIVGFILSMIVNLMTFLRYNNIKKDLQ